MDGSCTPPSTPPARLVVLVSGNGSNLQAIIDGCAAGAINADISMVVSNVANAFGLQRATAAGIPVAVVERLDGEPRTSYDARLLATVTASSPDIVVLAGWMRILTSVFLDGFPNRVVNLHPALPGELPGTHAIERAWQEALAGERTVSGVMVHLVPDEGVDNGPVLLSESVEIRLDDTLDTFSARMHATEHRLLVDAVAQLCDDVFAPNHPRTPPSTPQRTTVEQP
jgi:phosphoribosylglycinamide formyltransferase-1